MQENSVLCKTVGELRDFRFVIPDYQRGYRWTRQEVNDLLDDISSFDIGSQKEPLFYYLQPLVVRRVDEITFEVVDGQQRLTTIFIIFKFAADEMKSAKCPYSLEYTTHEGSKTYLDNLKISGEIDKENIDYYHITLARQTISSWLNKQPDKAEAISDFYKRLMSSTRFIWYELPVGVDPKVEFRKLNVGKIRLTNAELIKALLLSKDNFKGELESKLISKRQDEISIAWDNIEQHMQQPLFWSFLSKDLSSVSRIDLIFDIIAHEYADDPIFINPPQESDNLYSFLVLYQIMNKSNSQDKLVEKIWRDVETVYDRFCDWYNDPDKYHLVGYLTQSGVEINDIYKKCKNTPNSQVVKELKRLSLDMKKYADIKILTDLDYDNKKHFELKKLLLLFNIATLICKSDKQDRFPFDVYIEYNWDIEHIHAIRDKLPGKFEDARDYLSSLQEEFIQMLEEPSDDGVEIKKQYAEAIIKLKEFLSRKDIKLKDAEDFYLSLSDKYSTIIQEDNNIRNLTLLDSETNRSYKNVTYRQKRRKIIERDSEGRFIPLCTRNVFLKYYSPNAKRLTRWEVAEREDYKKNISSTLSAFFEGVHA